MASLQLTKVREVNPDLVLFTANGTAMGLRKQISFSRTLPDNKSGTPTIKAGVKAVYDREVKDSTGVVKYVQPASVTISLAYPTSATAGEVDEMVDAAVTAFKEKYSLLCQGLLPDASFSSELEVGISNR